VVSLRVQVSSLAGTSLEDFTPTWFKGVGYNLLVAFFSKALLTPVLEFLLLLWVEARRFWDRRLTCDRAKTRAKTQQAYQQLYTDSQFDLDLCYTDQVTTVFICLSLSPVLPLMLPACFLNLLALYWKDKLIRSLA